MLTDIIFILRKLPHSEDTDNKHGSFDCCEKVRKKMTTSRLDSQASSNATEGWHCQMNDTSWYIPRGIGMLK
jgi:hypothetical protein